MLLPGPEAQQLATYIGWRLHGIRGGLAAGAFFIIPSIFFLLALSYVYAAYGNLPQVDAVLDGFKAVVVAIVVEAVIKIGKRAFRNSFHLVIAALAFTAIYFLHIPFPLIVLGAAFPGIAGSRRFNPQSSKPEIQNSVADTNQPSNKKSLLKTVAAFALLWLAPFVLLLALFGGENLLIRTYLFFSQAALVIFGGAYAVLAYVNQAVVSAGWITATQSVDGLALAETTPGPLIMVLQFVGFMTGWNNPMLPNQIASAVAAALVATYTTFLPSFFFIFVGAPYIERLRHNKNLTAALSGVTAAVGGVILNLALTFGATVAAPGGQIDFFALGLAILSFAALYFAKIDVLIIVICSGVLSSAKYLLLG